jgi:hypothetical protein
MHVEMGVERLIPGVQEQEAPELASQVVGAKLQKALAGGPQQQGEQRAFVAQDKCVEFMGEGKDAVEIRHLKEFGLSVFKPLGLGERLALGTVAIATRVGGIALAATLLALFGVSPEFRRPTDHDVMHDLVVGWRHGVSRAIGWTIETEDGSDFPLGGTTVRFACRRMALGCKRGHLLVSGDRRGRIDAQKIKGATDGSQVGASHTQVAGGGIEGAVSEQQRNGARIYPGFEQMGGKGMSPGMDTFAVLQLGGLLSTVVKALGTGDGHGVVAILSWEEPRLAPRQPPRGP